MELTYKLNGKEIEVYLDGVNAVSFVCLTTSIQEVLVDIINYSKPNRALFLLKLKQLSNRHGEYSFVVNFIEYNKVDKKYPIDAFFSSQNFFKFVYGLEI